MSSYLSGHEQASDTLLCVAVVVLHLVVLCIPRHVDSADSRAIQLSRSLEVRIGGRASLFCNSAFGGSVFVV